MITRGNLSKINTFPRVIDTFQFVEVCSFNLKQICRLRLANFLNIYRDDTKDDTKNRREPLLIPGDFRVSFARAFQITRQSAFYAISPMMTCPSFTSTLTVEPRVTLPSKMAFVMRFTSPRRTSSSPVPPATSATTSPAPPKPNFGLTKWNWSISGKFIQNPQFFNGVSMQNPLICLILAN